MNMPTAKKVAVIMGSDSDLPVVMPAIQELKRFGIETEARVMSAHRTPAEAAAFADSARERGYGVLIAAPRSFRQRRVKTDLALSLPQRERRRIWRAFLPRTPLCL